MNRLATALALALAFVPLAAAAAPERSLAPVLAADGWLNGRATAASTHDRVVIVDVFTFACINCKHVIPELRKLHATYPRSQLAIVGVHTPETAYERNRAEIARNLAAQGITWPVALDPDNRIWNAYDNEYWPTQYVFDRHGKLRDVFVGEGNDGRVEALVGRLLAER